MTEKDKFLGGFIAALAALTLTFSAVAQSATVLEFREPNDGPLARYVRAVLTEAYDPMGVEMRYVSMPRARSLVEANKGNIAGELARVPTLSDDFSNLIRVNVPLYDFDIVLVANRRDCGSCDFAMVENVAYVNGVKQVEEFLASEEAEHPDRNIPVIKATKLSQLFTLIETDRVAAVLMTNFEFEQSELAKDRNYIAVPLRHNLAYHYLHKRHEKLVPQLTAKLEMMMDAGRMDEIAAREGVEPFQEIPPLEKQPFIRLIAGQWSGLTNPDGTGMYWRLMREIFDAHADELELNASSFSRANQSLAERRYDIMLGTYEGQQPKGTIVSTTHFDYDRPVYAFTKDEESMQKLKSGEMQRPVCHVKSYDYAEFLPAGLSYYSADNTLDCFAILDIGRVGAVVDYRENVPEWSAEPYQEWQLHDSMPLHVAFQDTELGHQLKAVYEKAIREIIRSGRIADIYTPARLKSSRVAPLLVAELEKEGSDD